MEVEMLREKLHEYINIADEKHLSAIYLLVEENIPTNEADIFDEETMNMIYQRVENHKNGTSKSYTVEESFILISQHKK